MGGGSEANTSIRDVSLAKLPEGTITFSDMQTILFSVFCWQTLL